MLKRSKTRAVGTQNREQESGERIMLLHVGGMVASTDRMRTLLLYLNMIRSPNRNSIVTRKEAYKPSRLDRIRLVSVS